MKRHLILILTIIFGSCFSALAQIRAYYGPDSAELAAFKRDSVKTVALKAGLSLTKARPFPLPASNPKDIKFYHRYWRDIDLTNPQNKVLKQPKATLIEAALAAVKKGAVTAYDPTPGTPENPAGDAFCLPISYQQIMTKLTDTAIVDQFDADGNKIGSIQKIDSFIPDKITGYRIKEDVYLDKTRSRVITRIVGIAPLLKIILSSGENLGVQPLCWFTFNQFRKVLVTMPIDSASTKQGMSLDDFFLQRHFSSTIIEESNPLGTRIKDYAATPAEQEKEAKRIEQKIAFYRGRLWAYGMLEIEDETNGTANNGPKTAAQAKSANQNKQVISSH